MPINNAYDDTKAAMRVNIVAGSAGGGVGAIYNSTATTYSSGASTSLWTDDSGNLKVREQYSPVAEDNTAGVVANLQKPVNSSTYAPTNYKNTGGVTKAVIKASAGNVYSLRVSNGNASLSRWFQLHNKATAPSATESATRTWIIPAGSTIAPSLLQLDTTYFSPSAYFSTGIGWAISSTATVFTDAATAADHEIDLNYV